MLICIWRRYLSMRTLRISPRASACFSARTVRRARCTAASETGSLLTVAATVGAAGATGAAGGVVGGGMGGGVWARAAAPVSVSAASAVRDLRNMTFSSFRTMGPDERADYSDRAGRRTGEPGLCARNDNSAVL